MNDAELNIRLVNLETAVSHNEKAIEDLSDMIVKQGKIIDTLQKQNELLRNMLNSDIVRPIDEETPPPHY